LNWSWSPLEKFAVYSIVIPISPFEKEIAAQAIGDSYPGQSSASFVGGMSSKTFSETFSKGVKPG
jgi:hypothetical protein